MGEAQQTLFGQKTISFASLLLTENHEIENQIENTCIYGSLLTYLAVISEIDSRCLWKILETFGGGKKSNNEPMGLNAIQGTPAFCLGQFCCWTMLERTVKKIPVWSLLFLDCTLYRRIIWQEKEAAAFFLFLFGRGVTSMSKLRKMSF